MTRDQKIAEARKLRGQGHKAREIAEILDAPESTVRNWYLGGDCTDCGAHVDGSGGGNSSERCVQCAGAFTRAQTKERLILEIQRWVDEFGRSPSAMDWNPYVVAHKPDLTEATKKRKIARFEEGDWPWASAVISAFGSWVAGLEAAGVSSNPPGWNGRWEDRAIELSKAEQ